MENEKEAIIEEYLRNLKITFTTSSFYSKDHPSFLRSVEDFKQKTDEILMTMPVIRVGVTNTALIVDGKEYKKKGMDELAVLLHSRKIKSIEIKRGVSIEEISSFMSFASLRAREILKAGGIVHALGLAKNASLVVEELDYSQLLKDAGEEVKDIWIVLLDHAVNAKDQKKINDLADAFGNVSAKFKVADFNENKDLWRHIEKLMSVLKESEKERFQKFNKDIVKLFLREKDICPQDSLKDLEKFTKDLASNELADILMEQMVSNENFDATSFKLLSKFMDKKKQEEVVSSLVEKLKSSDDPEGKQKLNKRITELFLSEDSPISEISRHALGSLLKNIAFESKFAFNRNFLHINYRFILLNLLVSEKDPEMLAQITEALYAEWEKIAQDRDWTYFRNLHEVLTDKIEHEPALKEMFNGLFERIFSVFEESLMLRETIQHQDYFVKVIDFSAKGLDFYLTKIFDEGIIEGDILRLFLKLFPEQTGVFLQRIALKHADVEFIEKLIAGLKLLDFDQVVGLFKSIFHASNEFLKIEVLKAMGSFSESDPEFLFSVLTGSGSTDLKIEALLIIMRDPEQSKRAAKLLLDIPDFWGLKSEKILENISIVRQAHLKEAVNYLLYLSRNIFFWRRRVKEASKQVLGEWNV